MWNSMAGLTVALLAAACSGNPPPVTLHADAEGTAQLQGRWDGEYWSDDTGRHGFIRFELTAAGDTARGAVLMIPAGREEPLRIFRPEHDLAATPAPRQSEYLRIHFVRCQKGHVQGTLSAYRDPETGHPLVTTFHGEVAGDSLGGTFSSYDRVSGRRTEGIWAARRRQ